jgi:hexosaminidase
VPGLDEDESYWLVVDDAGIYIDAASPWGVLHGLTTLSQLVDARGRIPHVAIDDRPAYAWRGLLLDPARHFLPAEDILRTLEAMARCKLNVLHLHLTDDQGFRFHVPEYPKLASEEAYTDEDLAEIVAHAAELGIRVLPEVDMPGHVTSWLTAYPELGSRQVEPAERFGVHAACLDPTSETVFAVIGCILDTLVRIFPDSCLHIGGDEVSPRWWSEDPKVRELMDREELDDVRAVQGYFNRRVGHMVTERGRRVVAWDEVLDAGAGSEWIIQAWRGSTMRDRARALGHAVVLSAPYYLDLHYPADVHYAFSPAASQSALLELEDALPQDPRFAHVAGGIRWTEQWRQGAVALEPDESGIRILGAEACLWSELVNSKVLDLRLWSRLPAVAERFWSSPSLTDSQDMYRRQDVFIDQVLPQCGIDLNGGTRSRWRTLGIESRWDDLLEMLEPVKWYGRLLGAEALAARLAGTEMPQARPYDLSSRLDGLIDHLPVDGRKARQIALSCERAGSGDEGAREDVDLTIHRWRALAEAHTEAPEGLGPMAVKLGVLGELIARRLADGVRAEPSALSELLIPEGEFMLALPPSLYRWLVLP